MEGEGHTFALHGINKQAHALHHNHGVGSFDGDDDVEEFFSHTDTEKFQATLHDTGWCVAIVAHDAIGERTVVDADANGCAVFAADGEQFLEARF